MLAVSEFDRARIGVLLSLAFPIVLLLGTGAVRFVSITLWGWDGAYPVLGITNAGLAVLVFAGVLSRRSRAILHLDPIVAFVVDALLLGAAVGAFVVVLQT